MRLRLFWVSRLADAEMTAVTGALHTAKYEQIAILEGDGCFKRWSLAIGLSSV
jgi:hypothetical protein